MARFFVCILILVAVQPPVSHTSTLFDHAGMLVARDMVSEMSLEEQVGQLIIVGMEYEGSLPIRSLTPGVAALIEDLGPGGVILYGINFDTVDQVTGMVAELQETSAIPLLVAADHEGGLVNRLTGDTRMGATTIPSASMVGRAASVDLAYRLGTVMGRELRALGITMSLGPVADVFSPSLHHTRFFGRTPAEVSTYVAAVTRGIEDAGVAAVVKHFPGLGGADLDTHDAMPVATESREEILTRDIPPFVAAIEAGASGVMTGHVALPALDPAGVPATVSRPIVTELLRDELGYEGLVVTDALIMYGVALAMDEEEIVVRALDAGVDLLLRPFDPRVARDAVLRAVAEGRLDPAVIRRAAERVLFHKLRLGLFADPLLRSPDPVLADEVVGSDEHRAIAAAVFEAAQGRPAGGVGAGGGE